MTVMIEVHSPSASRMTREQMVIHCLMIRAELEKVRMLIDRAIKRCEDEADD